MKHYVILFLVALLALGGCSKFSEDDNDIFIFLENKKAMVNGQSKTEEQWTELLRELVNADKLTHTHMAVDRTVGAETLYDLFGRLGECGIGECRIHLNATAISCTFATVDSGKFPEVGSIDENGMHHLLDAISGGISINEKFNTAVLELTEADYPSATEKLALANHNRNTKLMPIVICGPDVDATSLLRKLAAVESISTRPVLFIWKNRGYDYRQQSPSARSKM